MSGYKNWMLSQDKDFIKEICGDKEIKERFKDYCFKPISLQELKQLDEKYILCQAEPDKTQP